MKTIIYNNEIGNCASIIKDGGLVAVPTETVYGLAANGLNAKAVDEIYRVKNRPEIKPLSLMVESVDSIQDFCVDVPEFAIHFLENNWPGPVTAVFKAKDNIPSIVLAGGNTVGLRCPDADLTLQLIHNSGVPLAAPSANPSGQPSPKDAETVSSYFDGKIDAIINGGRCELGSESIIIDFSSDKTKVLRKGFLKLNITGITGQTGAGKTSVLNYLKTNNFAVIDCDELYHQMLLDNQYMAEDLFDHFPDAFDGKELNRKKLGSIVFSDNNALELLNRITHGYIFCEILNLCFKYQKDGFNNVAIDAIELISSGIGDFCDSIIGVIANPEIRKVRIMNRDNISEEEAIRRINSQKNEKYYQDNCDVIIDNNGTELELLQKLETEIKIG